MFILNRSCNCIAVLFAEPDYQGRPLEVSQQNGGIPVDDFNDKTQSIQISGECEWLFYTDVDFFGTTHLLTPNDYPTAPTGISSARALPPIGTVAISLFEGDNYTGRMVTLYASNVNFGSIDFNNQVSSAIVTGGVWTIYDSTDLQGTEVELGLGKYPDLGRYKFNDLASSVQLRLEWWSDIWRLIMCDR